MINIARKSLIILVVAVSMIFGSALMASAAPLKIGIVQIAEHPSLDAARDGFIDRLTELGYTDVSYDTLSAQGDQGTAITIAQKFLADNVDLVLAIATPAAIAAANVLTETPILITAVTDPVAADLVDSIEHPGTNVTGTSDLASIYAQLELLRDIVPTVKTVGILYNAGEINSVVQVEQAREAAVELGFSVVEATATNTGEVMQAAQSLIGRVDALYVPTDNTFVTALESVILVAEQAQLPLIAGEDDSVRRGALATVGINYYALGQQTADIAARVLEGADPADIAIEYQTSQAVFINLAAAEAFGVEVPQSVLDKAEEVIE